MTTTSPKVLALDFGGTKLASAVIDPNGGRVLSFCQQFTPAEHGSAASIQTMLDLGFQAIAQAGVKEVSRVGISFGGPVSADRQAVLHSFHVSDWEGVGLPGLASEAFGCPASMENDANAAALGAWTFDAHQSPDHMVYIQISTGVGAGFILNRNLYRGGALAGEFGHITAKPGGERCTCGKNGCVESICSGWALARDGQTALHQVSPGSPLRRLASVQGDRVDARIVFQAAREGDALAQKIIEDAFSALGTAIANTICLLDPGLVLLGGGVMRSWDLIQPILETTLEREVHPMFKNRYRLDCSKLEGRETLLGAALLSD
jgi:glucokinase